MSVYSDYELLEGTCTAYPKNVLHSDIAIVPKKCFFVMSFEPKYDELYKIVHERLEKREYLCIREDKFIRPGLIVMDIINHIKNSYFVIVDISSNRGNVFYELGLAHCMRECKNVILIKRKRTKLLFDLKDYPFITYSKDEYTKLADDLLAEMDKREPQHRLCTLLQKIGILSYEEQKYATSKTFFSISLYVADICSVLENPNNKLKRIDDILQAVYKMCVYHSHKNNLEQAIIGVRLFALLLATLGISNPKKMHYSTLLGRKSNLYRNMDDEAKPRIQTDFALTYAKFTNDISPVIDWIILYFAQSKSTKIDLNRYRLEKFLIESKNEKVQKSIIEGLQNEQKHICEHMADIIGARRLESARDVLISKLENEDWSYCAASIIAALGRLTPCTDSVNAIARWLEAYGKSVVEYKYYFVIHRAVNSLNALDTERKTYNYYNNEYKDVLEKYRKAESPLVRKEVK